MKQQQFNGYVDQVAGGDIYNQLTPHAVCPRCARGFMTAAQKICAPCERDVSRKSRVGELYRQLGLLLVMWLFFYSWIHERGLEGRFFVILSCAIALVATKIVVWIADAMDDWVKGK